MLYRNLNGYRYSSLSILHNSLIKAQNLASRLRSNFFMQVSDYPTYTISRNLYYKYVYRGIQMHAPTANSFIAKIFGKG